MHLIYNGMPLSFVFFEIQLNLVQLLGLLSGVYTCFLNIFCVLIRFKALQVIINNWLDNN